MRKSLIQTYPLLRRALREQSALDRMLGGTLTPQMRAVQYNALRLIEEHVDAPAAQKEAMMVGVVFANSSPFLFDELSRFAEEYGPAVDAVVIELLQDNGRAPMSPALAAGQAAFGTAMMQAVARDARNLPPEFLAQAAEFAARTARDLAEKEQQLLPNLESEALKDAYLAAKTALIDRFEKLARKPAAKAARPNPKM